MTNRIGCLVVYTVRNLTLIEVCRIMPCLSGYSIITIPHKYIRALIFEYFLFHKRYIFVYCQTKDRKDYIREKRE